MEKEQFLILIDKYINGEATDGEKLLVEAYYARLRGEWDVDTAEIKNEKAIRETLFKQISAEIKTSNDTLVKIRPAKRQLIWWYSAAALLLIVFSIAIILYKAKTAIGPRAIDYAALISPGGNKAILTLANGKKIILDSISNGAIAEQNGIQIKKKSNGTLEYIQLTASPSDNQIQNISNTIQTPRGGQYKIILEDGTIVWLNAASSLRYPLHFNGSERRVELSGEGYFEVAHLKTKPFIVVTSKQEVEVLGTHFNINAYSDEDEVKTTLLEGSVKVKAFRDKTQSKYLKPGEQSVLNNSNWQVKQVDAATQVDWKNGRFIFKDEELKSVMRKLSRWYDIEVGYTGPVENLNFSGRISRSKTLKDVLRILMRTNDVNFKVNERRVTVMP
ncbi:hypothetical protein OC25_05965 [Pedobacter kyungheensis]|uniref:Anti-sigma factor n=1 Tax=Pedobacter kyungheensis TaxID=1069985 RepID=A0A0C1FU80_9SPHI|nr:FecR family protein [Pedobacter kyungheensis]KIA95388.1 hypothetical protein OC25_05965 [Pedobacter kyungheensis]